MLNVDAINRILNDFLAPFDCTCELGTDFEYLTQSNMIHYTFVAPEKDSSMFMANVQERFPAVHADVFLWSFLHELGHRETEDDFEQEDWDEYMERIRQPISSEEYFNLPIEYAATAWAGEYIESHVDEIASLWNELVEAISNFYNTINLEL